MNKQLVAKNNFFSTTNLFIFTHKNVILEKISIHLALWYDCNFEKSFALNFQVNQIEKRQRKQPVEWFAKIEQLFVWKTFKQKEKKLPKSRLHVSEHNSTIINEMMTITKLAFWKMVKLKQQVKQLHVHIEMTGLNSWISVEKPTLTNLICKNDGHDLHSIWITIDITFCIFANV